VLIRAVEVPNHERFEARRAAVAAVAVGILALRADTRPGTGGPRRRPRHRPRADDRTRPSPPTPTETFTSTIHGISISYPAGWLISRATEPWTVSDVPLFQDPFADHLYDGPKTDHLFLGLSSQPLAGKTASQWSEDLLAFGDCRPTEQVTIDGASGLIGDVCSWATVAINDRGYFINLYTSPDEPQLSGIYDRTWFKSVLATVRLHPEDAIDSMPSPSP
jgi:hypothetical protein